MHNSSDRSGPLNDILKSDDNFKNFRTNPYFQIRNNFMGESYRNRSNSKDELLISNKDNSIVNSTFENNLI
jgi:hypothetical protein